MKKPKLILSTLTWRYGIRLTLAVFIVFLITLYLGLNEGYWAILLLSLVLFRRKVCHFVEVFIAYLVHCWV